MSDNPYESPKGQEARRSRRVPYVVAIAVTVVFIAALFVFQAVLITVLGLTAERDLELPAGQLLLWNFTALMIRYWWVLGALLLAVTLAIAHFAARR